MDRLTEAGAQSARPNRYAPIFVASSLTGLYSQRHVFHDPSNVVSQKFYGGRPDSLWDGQNVELSNQLTIIRRFGTSLFSSATYPQAPTCGFSFQLTNGTVQVLIDTPGAVYLDNQNGTKTTIFTKSSGAGQGFFVASGNTLYYGDGIDLLKYTPGNPNGLVWNWGIAAPTSQPSVTIETTSSAAVAWSASTFFSTMGLLVDGNNNVQSLTSVNSSGTNTTQYGNTGNGQPNWNNSTGGTTTDSGITWYCLGPLQLWKANTVYPRGSVIFVPNVGGTPIPSTASSGLRGLTYPGTTGGGIWSNLNATLTSGSFEPKFNPTTDTRVSDGNSNWNYLGAAVLWQHSTQYNSYWEWSNEVVVEPTLPNAAQIAAGQQTVYVQAQGNGNGNGSVNHPLNSGTGYTPPWATTPGFTTADGDLIWMCLGSKNWAANTTYTPWAANQPVFSAIVDTNGNFQVCVAFTGNSGTTEPFPSWAPSKVVSLNYEVIVQSNGGPVLMKVTTAGTTGASEPTWSYGTGTTTNDNGVVWTSQGVTTSPAAWGTQYGAQTTDGGVTWVCVGPSANSTWAATTKWYLPATGFVPPTPSQPYGGALVIQGSPTAYTEACIASGLSGSAAPTWPSVGSTVADNGATWYTVAAYSANSLTWQTGHVYAYSYKARTPTDAFVNTSPPGWASPLGSFLGSGTGGISTASPVFTITGSNNGAVNIVQGIGSTDPQVDTVVIWRDADGGGPSNMFELTEIPNPPPVNGQAQPWTFQDFLPDAPTSQFPGLNTLIPAPIDGTNNPPPAGFRPLCNKLHFQRIFGAYQNIVYFSGGPDVITGNPNECFYSLDNFEFDSTVIGCIHTPAGLLCPTTTDFDAIYGGPSTASFYSAPMLPGVGMLSVNGWDMHGGEIYFFSSDSQFWALNPSVQLARIGFPIGDKLVALNAANVYVTVHESGTDNAVYVGDGSTGWYRLNPHQIGADMAGENVQVWSPFAAIVGGCQMIQSLASAPGVRTMLVGGTGTNQSILKRDTTLYADNGSAYHAWCDIGAITLVDPGQRAAVKFIEADFMSVGTQPGVSWILDDPTPSPTWNLFTGVSTYDPPVVYQGTSITPNYWPDRYYMNQTRAVAQGRRIRLKIDFGSTDTVRNELISFAVFGKKYQER